MKKLFRLVLIMAWLSGWSARKEIAVPAVSSEQTDINVEVTITYDSAMKSDFADIRFTDSDGGTELYHFRDKYRASTSALFVVKIPVIPVAGKTIYLYFGNASASSASDGANTFPFFDDFSGDLSKWDITDPAYNYIDADALRFICTWAHLQQVAASKATFGVYHAAVFRAFIESGTGAERVRLGWTATAYATLGPWGYYRYHGSSTGRFYYSSSGYITVPALSTSSIENPVWTKFKIHQTAIRKATLALDDGTPTAEATASSDQNARRLYFCLVSTNPCPNFYLGEVYVMKLPQDGTVIGTVTPSTVTTYAGKLWRASKLAYQPNGEAWGTASVPGENDEVKAVSFGPLLQVQDVMPDPCSGWIFHTYFIMARKHVRPEIKIPLRYSGRFWSFVAQLMGSDSVSGSDPYTHLMTLIEAIDGANLYGTLAASFGTVATGIVEWPSFKPTGFSIFGPDEGGFMTLDVKGLGDRIETDGGAATNYSEMSAVTHIQQSGALPLRVPFGGLRLRMNDHTGVALSSSDYVKVKKVAFDFERIFGEEFNSRGSQSRQWETDEPIENGIPDAKMVLLLPDLETSRLKTHADGTLKKADLYFQLNDNYDVLIEMPSLQPIPMPVSKQGQGRVSHEIAFAVARATANPTGMAFADWRLTLRDGWGTSYIATT